LRPLGKNCRIVALTDASFNKNVNVPSLYGAFFYISDYSSDYDQELFTQAPELADVKADSHWVN
jgi:hypothetical protein